MYKLIAFIIVTLISGAIYGHNNPELATSNIYAHSGLKLRAQPTTSSAVIKVLSYGEKVTILENEPLTERIEWMSGKWVKVSHEGEEGYLFGGFISSLPVPRERFEMTQNDLDITYPLISWAEHNFDEQEEQNIYEGVQLYKITQKLENDIILTRRETPYEFTVDLKLPNRTMEDAYHLVRSMFMMDSEREIFDNKALFIPDDQGDIYRIKIDLDNPIIIKKKDGHVIVRAITYHHCADEFCQN